MVCAVKVEENAASLGEVIPLPFKVTAHPCRDSRKERIEPADLLGKEFSVALIIAGLELAPTLRILMQGVRYKRDVDADGHNRSDHV